MHVLCVYLCIGQILLWDNVAGAHCRYVIKNNSNASSSVHDDAAARTLRPAQPQNRPPPSLLLPIMYLCLLSVAVSATVAVPAGVAAWRCTWHFSATLYSALFSFAPVFGFPFYSHCLPAAVRHSSKNNNNNNNTCNQRQQQKAETTSNIFSPVIKIKLQIFLEAQATKKPKDTKQRRREAKKILGDGSCKCFNILCCCCCCCWAMSQKCNYVNRVTL